MSTVMTSGHEHHSVLPSDLDVLDAITKMPSTSTNLFNGDTFGQHPFADHMPTTRRPLDTLQALRRPPIDPIVLAASLSSGPHVTRHHFLHSFGPKTESKQMTRSERARRIKEEEQERIREEENLKSKAQSSRLSTNKTRPRAGSYANCDADDDVQEKARNAAAISQSILEELGEIPQYQSRQMPRSERLRIEKEEQLKREEQKMKEVKQPDTTIENKKVGKIKQEARPELVRTASEQLDNELIQRKNIIQAKEKQIQHQIAAQTPIIESIPKTQSFSSIVRPPPLHVRCYARTRIPTPHGEVLCHLYRNNRDQKEHLALVIDPAQNAADDRYADNTGKEIRSKTLDEVWGPTETEMERIVRGAYVGRLGPTYQEASKPGMKTLSHNNSSSANNEVEPPLVRIHSECYTGETIGSQRCDCGEQLDEAIRLIHADARPAKGVVVYLRQEGRGIGLLDKLMAYNLQDMGHDTVAANILLGHLADARKYDIAAEILRDLGVGSCRLLTNNPDKMEALEAEGISVVKRVAMVPRIWRLQSRSKHRKVKRTSRKRQTGHRRKTSPRPLEASIVSQFEGGESNHATGTSDEDGYVNEYSEDDDEGSFTDDSRDSYLEHHQRRSGATLIGASVTRGPELEKYLRTKVEKMGHLLELPVEESQIDKGEHHSKNTDDSSMRRAEQSDIDTTGSDIEPLVNEAELQTYIGKLDEGKEEEEEDDDEILINNQ